MDTVIGGLGGLGAGIFEVAIVMGSFAGGIAAGVFAARRMKINWIGWVVGIMAFAGCALIFGPMYDAARRIGCKGSDNFQSCMDNDSFD
jgi:hypothetical protein